MSGPHHTSVFDINISRKIVVKIVIAKIVSVLAVLFSIYPLYVIYDSYVFTSNIYGLFSRFDMNEDGYYSYYSLNWIEGDTPTVQQDRMAQDVVGLIYQYDKKRYTVDGYFGLTVDGVESPNPSIFSRDIIDIYKPHVKSGRYFIESDFDDSMVRPVIVSDDIESKFPLGSERIFEGPYGGDIRIKVVGVIDRNESYGGANGRPIQFAKSMIYPERKSDISHIDIFSLSSILSNTVFSAQDREELNKIDSMVAKIPMFNAKLLSSEEYRKINIDRHVPDERLIWIHSMIYLFVFYFIFGLCAWYIRRNSKAKAAT